ncbi:hypothetical protein FQ192_07415 [Pseudomonas sp. ANT_J12]|nr:hypothetical protein FQ192_07415 [Pseudomonas sp. ANT_J12]
MWRRCCLWRGGLPPLGCESDLKKRGSAAHSNGGKPPRHRVMQRPLIGVLLPIHLAQLRRAHRLFKRHRH